MENNENFGQQYKWIYLRDRTEIHESKAINRNNRNILLLSFGQYFRIIEYSIIKMHDYYRALQ